VDYGEGGSEDFHWDGLALIQRGDEQFMNEPHIGGGNPVASSNGTSYFNDALGTTVGAKKDGKYSAAALSAFGENLSVDSPTPTQNSNFFTGKPYVEGLGHAFLMRNYRASLAKWQTADPLGYPDGWNQLAYGNNSPHAGVDQFGAAWTTEDMYQYYLNGDGTALTLTQMGLKDLVWSTLCSDYESDWEAGGEWWRGIYLPYSQGHGNNPTGFMDRMKKQIDGLGRAKINNHSSGSAGFSYNFSNGYNFSPIVWALGGGSVYVTQSSYNISWHNGGDGYIYYTISGSYNLHYRDDFSEPTGIPYIEWGTPYAYYDSWLKKPIYLTGRIPE
jgi:RHS repeat-associated protein